MNTSKAAFEKIEHKFDDDIRILDSIYSDMVEAIHMKPSGNNIEELRLYMDNLYVTLNRTVFRVQEIKNSLNEGKKLIFNTWNPPA